MKPAKTAKTVKPAKITPSIARAKVMAWFAETYAVLDSISSTASDIATEVNREDSPFFGAIEETHKLRNFAGRLGDLSTDLVNNWPAAPEANLMNPLAEEVV